MHRARLAMAASVTPVTGVTLLSLIVPLKNPVKSKLCDNKYNNYRKIFNLIERGRYCHAYLWVYISIGLSLAAYRNKRNACASC